MRLLYHHFAPQLEIPSPMKEPSLKEMDFLQSPLRHTLNLLRTSPPLLAAPRAPSAPRPHHVRPPLPALGSRIHVLAPQFPPPQHHVQHHNNSSPQCNLSQNIPRQPCVPPNRLRPSTNPSNQGVAAHPPPTSAPTQASPQPPHAWPSYYPVQPSQQPPTQLAPEYTTPPTNTTATATVLRPLPPGHYDTQGRPLPLHLQNYEPEHDPWHADNH